MGAPFNGIRPDCKEGQPAADSYAKQLAEMEARFRHTRRQISGWRLIALLVALIALVSTGGGIYVTANRRTEVYVVEVDAQTGEPMRHSVLEPISASDAIIAHTLGRWIQMTRGRSIDPVVLRANWDNAYQFVTSDAKPAVDAYAREIDAFNPDTLGKEAISVELASVTRQSNDTFQVRWTETLFQNGQRGSSRRYTANLSIDFMPPSEPRQIQVNPLGLMITNLHLQPDFG